MGVRYGGAKRGRYRFECPYASSDEKKYGNLRCRNQSAPRCALHTGIHPDSRQSSYFFVPFLFIVIEPGCYRSIFFNIWLNCYGHHIGYLTYQWDNILNRRSNNLSHVYDLSFSYISAIFLPFFLFFLTWLNCYDNFSSLMHNSCFMKVPLVPYMCTSPLLFCFVKLLSCIKVWKTLHKWSVDRV